MPNFVRIAAGQGFYGDSPRAAISIALQRGADYIVHDALAELTLSILQKDRQRDSGLGYARDLEITAHNLIPLCFKNGIKLVTNSGGLNPYGAAKKVSEILQKQGITNLKIAVVTGDDLLERLNSFQASGLLLSHLDTNQPFSEVNFPVTHANVYIGAACIAEALDQGADLILAGRVADPCLSLGILVHHFGWNLDGESLSQTDLNKLASGITVGHLLECGGQVSGGNSYAEWPLDYSLHNLGYPIATVYEDGTAVFSKLPSDGGRVSRDTLREQLVYEIHNPSCYITPDVVVDFTQVSIKELSENQVEVKGAIGKPRPDMLKLCIGLHEGFMSDMIVFFSWPFAYEKCQKFIEAVKGIWATTVPGIQRMEFQLLGVNGIHGSEAPIPENLFEMNEIGIRMVIKHTETKTGSMAFKAIVCLGLNGPPGLTAIPGWGKENRALLSLWPTLIPRELVQTTVHCAEASKYLQQN